MAKSITHSFFSFSHRCARTILGYPPFFRHQKNWATHQKKDSVGNPRVLEWTQNTELIWTMCICIYYNMCIWWYTHIYIYAIMTYWYIVKYVIYLSSTHGESFRSSELPKRNPTRWSREAMKARSNSRAGAWKWSSWIPLARRPMWPWRPWLCGFRVFHTRCITVESTIWTGHEKSQEICLRHKG